MSTGFQYKDNYLTKRRSGNGPTKWRMSSPVRPGSMSLLLWEMIKRWQTFTKGSPKSAAWDEVFRNRLMERPVVSIENIPATSGPR